MRSMGRACAALGIGCVAALAGCTHNHYYYGSRAVPAGTMIAPCDPPVVSGQVVSGQVISSRPVTTDPVLAGTYCDIPPAGNQKVVLSSKPADPVVTSNPPPRVVVSDPTYGTRRNGWRKRSEVVDPSTRISGTIRDEDLLR